MLVLLVACSSGGEADDDPLAPASSAGNEKAADQAATSYGRPTVLGTIQDRSVNESSGLVASRRNPDRYWTHNDSGDGPFLYCLGSRGESCGVWSVTGAGARDWEDVATGPGPVGDRSYLYVGDIGNNLSDQEQFTIYRVAEPEVRPEQAASTRGAPVPTEEAEALRFRYPDGPHNAEALLVHPASGDLYIVTKGPPSSVYVARAPLAVGAAPTTLTHVADLRVGDGDSRNVEVTGGDISPDGRRVAVCTYGDAYELQVSEGERFDAVWQQPPRRFPVGFRAVGEAIAYRLDGKALLTTSEDPFGTGAPLNQVERR